MTPRDMQIETASRADGHFILRNLVCALRILLVSLLAADGISTVQAACVSDGQGGVTNNGGACTVVPPVNRITATGSGTTTAAGVTLSVPYGVAVTASGGASVNLGQDDVAVSGGTASGTTGLTVHNTTGPGAETLANGIQVVQALSSTAARPRPVLSR